MKIIPLNQNEFNIRERIKNSQNEFIRRKNKKNNKLDSVYTKLFNSPRLRYDYSKIKEEFNYDYSKIKEEFNYDMDNHFHKLLGFYIKNNEYTIKNFSMVKKDNNVEEFSLKIIFEEEDKKKTKIIKKITSIVKLYILKNYVHINNYNNIFYNLIESENNNIILNNKNINNYEYTIILKNKTKISILKGGACDSISNNRKRINFIAIPIYSEPLVEQYSYIIKSLLRPTVNPQSFHLSSFTREEINAVKPSFINFKNYILTMIADVTVASKIFGNNDVNLYYVYNSFGNYIKWSNYLLSKHLANNKYLHNGIDDIHLINSFIPNELNYFNINQYLVFYHSFLHLLDQNYMYNKNSLISRENIKRIQSYINAFMDRRFRSCVYKNLQLNRGKFLLNYGHYNYILPYSIKTDAINSKLNHYKTNFMDDNNNIVPEYRDQINHIIYPTIHPLVYPTTNKRRGTNILINDDLLNTLVYTHSRSDNRIRLG